MRKNRKQFKCESEAQKKAIRASYARHAAKKKQQQSQDRVEAPFPHFRHYKKSGHPALIVGEQQTPDNVDEYRFRKVMHGDKDGKRTNETVSPNPDPTDPRPMKIGKRIRHDRKSAFSPKPLPWKYPKKDE